ncbi:helix-turn-helix transcriptional regulator [Microvirga sp. HBU67558]|uniref:helix-turn-helix transcriptional regulator n=1 Tax=Microvirga TaxID=186650 RepID=UPI001B36E962|nr:MULTISPECIES: helix-turn-helix transcriptional regulator [unclassified Microvirga]MBQ0822299.1 helix-turn-helix transcriptional regulator [Microvirga sp. HBU67558]
MKPDQAFSDLIGRIYDCALDTSAWPAVLGEITQAFGGVMADLMVHEPFEPRQIIAAVHNWPDELVAKVQANVHINPALPIGLAAPVGQPLCTTRDFPELHRSRFWRTCFMDRGIFDYVTTPLTRTVTSFATWGVVGSEARGAFGDEDLELARLLSPHIKRAVDISGVIGHRRVEAGTLRAALDALAIAALIVEPDGTVLFRNRAADQELASQKLLRDHNGRLVGVTPEAVRLLGMLGSFSTGRTHHGIDAFLTDSAGRTMHATGAALDQAGEEIGSPILVLLREPEAAFTTPLASAASLYRLTIGELQVLGQVLQGHTLADAADILGLARSTVKTHLEGIYRKTQTNRQAELVSRIMSLASPLGGRRD